MPKPQKIEAVADLKRRLEESEAALLAEFRGLKVEEIKELRRALAAIRTEFRVVKNALARIAVREAQMEGLLPLFEGSTAIAFIKGDPVEAAKRLDEISKKYPALTIKGGIVEGRVLDASGAGALAKIKPRDVLLAELARMLQSPLQKLAILLAAPLRDLAYALASYQRELEAEAEAQPPVQAEAEAAEQSAEAQEAGERAGEGEETGATTSPDQTEDTTDGEE